MNTDSQPPDPNESNRTPSSASRTRLRKHWIGWIAILCILIGGYLFSQRSSSGKSGSTKNEKQESGAVPVAVTTVTLGNMGVYINAIGTVTPVYTVTVTSRVAGELVEIHYTEGQMVNKGDLLAVIDPRPYQATFVQAQGQLARDEALLNNARIDLARYQMAFEQHAVPEQTLATQRATVAEDEGVVKLDEGNLDSAKVNLDYTQITAPISGRVGLRSVDPGNIVQANGTTGLLTIAQLQPITVIFPMAEDFISDVSDPLRAGSKLRVDALDREDQHEIAQGTLLTIDNQVDVTTGTVRARATFRNENFKLFPNEFVNAKLLVKTLYRDNIIPTASIQHKNDQAFVYVVNPADDTVQTREIQIATTEGNSAAVTGVNPGETLVTDGFDRLEDESKVVVRQQNGEQSQSAAPAEPTPQGSATKASQRNPQAGPNK